MRTVPITSMAQAATSKYPTAPTSTRWAVRFPSSHGSMLTQAPITTSMTIATSSARAQCMAVCGLMPPSVSPILKALCHSNIPTTITIPRATMRARPLRKAAGISLPSHLITATSAFIWMVNCNTHSQAHTPTHAVRRNRSTLAHAMKVLLSSAASRVSLTTCASTIVCSLCKKSKVCINKNPLP